jgi:SAM-dependent methyltransferase
MIQKILGMVNARIQRKSLLAFSERHTVDNNSLDSLIQILFDLGRRSNEQGEELMVLDFAGGDGSFLEGLIAGAGEKIDCQIYIADLEGDDAERRVVQDLSQPIATEHEGRFDVVWSYNSFEHFSRPWIAAANVVRFLKPGGAALVSTVFSWRYHPVPKDYYRFSDDALRFLFSEQNHMSEICCGYDLSRRRENIVGGYFSEKDKVPVDLLGGFRENWSVFYAGRKLIENADTTVDTLHQ